MSTAAPGGPSEARGPLSGLTVVDLSWHLAGPFCTLILADLGARVIKVEAPNSNGGYDPIGFARRYYKGQDMHYLALNRNKESIALDLKSPDGLRMMKELVQRADVLFNNFRPGVMDRLGLGFSVARELNPRIVYASLTAFGASGPYMARPGVDLVIQALSGGMSMTGEPGRPPVRAGIPIADLAGGMWAAISILAAVRSGQATEIDVSLLDGQIAMLPYFAAYYFLDGSVPDPQGSGGHSAIYSAYRCSDGRYVVIAATTQSHWKGVCSALGRPQLADDERFTTAIEREKHRTELHAELAALFAQDTSAVTLARLQSEDVPAARVNRLDEALAEQQVRGRDMVIGLEHVLGGTLQFVGTPVKMSGFQPRYVSAPLSGQDTGRIIAEFGLSGHEEGASGRKISVEAPT